MSFFRKLFGGPDKTNRQPADKKLDLEKLLMSADINSSIVEIDNYIGELCAYGDALHKLTEPQKQFYYNQCLEREVNNGGFSQYFLNSSGDYAHQTLGSLQAIGAASTANILQRAIDQFPSGIAPEDRAQRHEILEQIQEVADHAWSELDQAFYAYPDDLNAMNMAFVRSNKDKF